MIGGKAAWFGGTKIFCKASIAYPQEILKTYPKSYPSYFHTYPRNGKTTVIRLIQTHSLQQMVRLSFACIFQRNFVSSARRQRGKKDWKNKQKKPSRRKWRVWFASIPHPFGEKQRVEKEDCSDLTWTLFSWDLSDYTDMDVDNVQVHWRRRKKIETSRDCIRLLC